MITLKLSTPADVKEIYPQGWESSTGTEPMPQYEKKETTDGIDAIIFEIIGKIETALNSRQAKMTHQNDKTRKRRSVSLTVNIEVEKEKLTGWKSKLPRPANLEITRHYKQAGWDGIGITNHQPYRNDESKAFKEIQIRLTHWQNLI